MKTNILSLFSLIFLSAAALADTHTLTIYADGCDAPNVITCATGTEVSVTASAVLPGSYFVRWSDGSTANPRLVTVNSDMTLTAEFAQNHTLSIYADGCDAPNMVTCASGTEVSVTAEATLPGHYFVRWSDGSTDNPRLVTVNSDMTLTAEFANGPFVLTDGTAYTRSELQAFPSIAYTRNYSSTNWVALYVPFEMEYSDWAEDFDIADINAFHQYDRDDDGTFEEMTLEILRLNKPTSHTKANYPYLIRPKTVGSHTITVNNRTLYAALSYSRACSSMHYDFTFTGIYESTYMAPYSEYFMSTTGGVVQSATGTNLKPMRWYLTIAPRDDEPAYQSLPSIINIVEKDEEIDSTTGIEVIEHSGNTSLDVEKIFRDGHILIRRGETYYTLTGEIIK